MSLVRRLWLLVITTTLLAFGGSLAVTTFSFRDYLEQQLTVKNIDNAAVLAMTLTHTGGDAVERELSIAAQFDTGHYELIRLTAPDGRVLAERSASDAGGAASWLARLVPLRPKPGIAQVSSGWHQVGTLTVASQSRYAYASLWQGAVRLALWFALGGVATGLAGVWLLGRVTRPLRDVVAQAEDIGRRRFVTIAEPAIPELRSVARAMNATVARLREMFGQEAQRIESLRRRANLDEVTGLPNRRHFIDRLGDMLRAEDAPPLGQLILLRIADLAGLDRGLGRSATDELLRQAGGKLMNVAPPGAFAGRTAGGEFALLLPGLEDGRQLAERLVAEVGGLVGARAATGHEVHVATCRYRQGLAAAELLARADETLADAQADPAHGSYSVPDDHGAGARLCGPEWEQAIREALVERRLRLVEFPVTAPDGALIHMECPVRMQIEPAGEWLPAARFVPLAKRRQLSAELDLAVVTLALEKLAGGSTPIAINLAAESLQLADFGSRLGTLLDGHRDLLPRLWLELGETGVLEQFGAFRAWCAALRHLPCRIGLEHVGHRISEIGRFHDLGIDYLKVDASFVRGIDTNVGNRAFLEGLCRIAHAIGLSATAEGVCSGAEAEALARLGFDGLTGPEITRRFRG